MPSATPPAAACLVTTTLPDRAAADQLAGQLVQERLAACVQIVGPIASVYRWHGAVERAEEWQCQCKTTGARLEALQTRIRELHSYEVPEIVALPLTGDAAYLAWIEESVSP
jgi:periplasmic divalent cation tolerance protein